MASFSHIKKKLQEKLISFEVVLSFAERLFRKYSLAIKCSNRKFGKSEGITETHRCLLYSYDVSTIIQYHEY